MHKKSNFMFLSGVFLVTFLFILLNLPFPHESTIIPAENVENYSPIVELILLEKEQTANIGPNDSGEVVFNGQVTAKFQEGYILPGSSLNVTLTSEDTWETSIIEPKHIIFTEDGNQTFRVSVKAPLLSSYYNNNGQLKVKGTWFLNPQGLDGFASPAKGMVGIIKIGQYHNFSLHCSEKKLELKLGDRTICRFFIKNHGNARDTFKIIITNLEELNRNGIYLSLSQNVIDIHLNGEDSIDIRIGVDDSLGSMGSHEIELEVRSIDDDGDSIPPQNLTLKLNVPSQYFYHTDEFANTVYFLIFIIIVAIIIVRIARKGKKKNNKKKI